MAHDIPSYLLYLLSVGKEKEMALQVHGRQPDADEVASWMQNGTVVQLEVSSGGEQDIFTLVVNFGHIVGARLAAYGAARSASF